MRLHCILKMHNKDGHYDIVSVLLHWVIAIFLIGLISLGWYMMSIADQPDSGEYFNLHKSFGIVAAILIFFRLGWKLSHVPIRFSSTIASWQIVTAKIVHWLLYACMILMPLTGFSGACFSNHGIVFFGLQLPNLLNPNHAVSQLLFQAHKIIAWTLVGLVVLHIFAAIKHLVIDQQNVFLRMLPKGAKK